MKTYKDLFQEICTPGINLSNDSAKKVDVLKITKASGIPTNDINVILSRVGWTNDELSQTQFMSLCQRIALFQEMKDHDININQYLELMKTKKAPLAEFNKGVLEHNNDPM